MADKSGEATTERKAVSEPDPTAPFIGFPHEIAPIPPAGESDAGQPSASPTGSRFTILRPHARGGLGQVSVARDEELEREVAFKEIQPFAVDDPVSRARFLLEAQVTGLLEHPGIVPVYGLGHYPDGRPYYAMRFIRGESLKETIHRFHTDPKPLGSAFETLEFRKLLSRFLDVCYAIEYAHSRGVLHRDLKPGNIMLGKYGETLVVDWGLAKVIGSRRCDEETTTRLAGTNIEAAAEATLRPSSNSGSAPTILGSALGTPAYMSPEQANGQHNDTGPATDIYSLGATLYTMLTGQPPFSGRDAKRIVAQVASGQFPRPRSLNRAIPPVLEAICLKAMSLRPEDRYDTARGLADDVENWLADEPTTAHRESLPARLARWSRRHRAYVRAGAGALMIIALIALVFRVIAARNEAENNRQRAGALVDALLVAPAEAIPYAIENLKSLEDLASPMLQSRFADGDLEKTQRLHAALGLSHFNHQEQDFLVDSVTWAAGSECSNLVTALRRDKASATVQLKARFAAAKDKQSRARLAITLLHLGDTTAAQEVLALGPDPSQRTTFILDLATWHADPADYVEALRTAHDTAFRSGLVLAVGRIGDPGKTVVRQALAAMLLDWYQHAPDAATHSACEWTLRQWQVELPQVATASPTTAGLGHSSPDLPEWFVNSQGQTMILIPAGSFKRKDDSKDTKEQTASLTRFYLSDREVSLEQFQRFVNDQAAEKPQAWPGAGPGHTGAHPAHTVSWYDAVLYCNWLSRQHGLTPCYEKTGEKETISGVTSDAWRLVREADGYRLPSEAQWEYACRAGTTTRFAHGNDDSQLNAFALLSGSMSHPCGSKLPNAWGLFDLPGNLWEWCQDWYGPYETGGPMDPLGIAMGGQRIIRGGSFVNFGSYGASAYRTRSAPWARTIWGGFRVAMVPSTTGLNKAE